MISIDQRLHREDVLFQLLGALPGEEFGAEPACHTAPDAPAEQRRELAELFFPVSEHDQHQIEQAKAVCQRCPVQGSCLQFALNHGEDVGIWGGATAEERRRLRAARETSGVAAFVLADDEHGEDSFPGVAA